MLEQNQFRNRPADFVYMLLLGAAMLLVRPHSPNDRGSMRCCVCVCVCASACAALVPWLGYDAGSREREREGGQAVSPLVDQVFLGPALSFMMVYVWAKYNPDAQVQRHADCVSACACVSVCVYACVCVYLGVCLSGCVYLSVYVRVCILAPMRG
jgi:hypothetical protein